MPKINTKRIFSEVLEIYLKVFKYILNTFLWFVRQLVLLLTLPLRILYKKAKNDPRDNYRVFYKKNVGLRNKQILENQYQEALRSVESKRKNTNDILFAAKVNSIYALIKHKLYSAVSLFTIRTEPRTNQKEQQKETTQKRISRSRFAILYMHIKGLPRKVFITTKAKVANFASSIYGNVTRVIGRIYLAISSVLVFIILKLSFAKVYLTPGIFKRKRGRPKKAVNRFPLNILVGLKNYLIRRYKSIDRYVTRKYDDFSLYLYNQVSPLFEKRIRYKFVISNSVLFASIFAAMLFSTVFYYSIIYTLPNPNNLNLYRPKQTTYIYDSQGKLLYKTYKDENRTLVKLDKVPTDFKNAIVSIEDSEFYTHSGISLPSMVRAAYANYKSGEIVQGASTITQQLVKNTLLSSERTLDRKVKEALLSLMIETKYSKDEILEMYLNTVSFGGTSYGIQEASLMYFGKEAQDLDLAESSMLAGLPAAPSVYTPYISIDKAKERQKTVLAQMLKDNTITVEQAKNSYEQELDIKYPESIKEYPHFVNYTTSYIEQKYGSELLNSGGLKIYTTLDPKVQDMVQQIVESEVRAISGYRISNGASLVTKNKTGEVIAMVGSKDYDAEDIDGFVNVTTALRQPGSSIKPFNYSLALNNGLTAASIIKDEPVTYKVAGSPAYTPKNYDNKFRGNVTIRRALANSLNIPSVKVLEINGVSNFVQYVQLFGINTWNRDYYGLSLALGAAEVRMADMNGAYSVFANNGDLIKINPILYIETPSGDILEYNSCIYAKDDFKGKNIIRDIPPCREKIIGSGNAFIIKTILTDFKARREAFGSNSILNVPGTGAKTGTTNDMKDNWTFGFNEEYTVGAWVGNNDGTPMSYVASGVTGASPIWAKVIRNLTDDSNKINIESLPSDVAKIEICPITGQLACNSCRGVSEYFIKGTEPKNKCSDRYINELKKVDKKDKDEDED